MSKKVLRGENIELDSSVLQKFSKVNEEELPDFHSLKSPLEWGLWVLYVGKEQLGINQMSAEDIAWVIREIKEISVEAISISNAFNRTKGKKVHVYRGGTVCTYGIMQSGKTFLSSIRREDEVRVFAFEPGKPFTSKEKLIDKILKDLSGEIKMVDPYCGVGTLDLLHKLEDRVVKILTRIENLGKLRDRDIFLRAFKELKLEKQNVDIRTCPNTDLHDRYIVSDDKLILLGYSLKDLGKKESFAVLMNKNSCPDTYNMMVENFNRRWKISTPL